jgi:hypothetical protein
VSTLRELLAAMLRRLEFGEPFAEKETPAGEWWRSCQVCGARVTEVQSETEPLKFTDRHNPGCSLAALLDDSRRRLP